MAKNPILDVLSRVDKQLATTVKRFQIAMKGRAGRLALKALRKLKRVPGPPVYPIRWTSEKQRRAYFATDGFGGGIPYDRSGDMAAGWDVEVADFADGVLVALSNPAPQVEFVQGFRAQGFHEDTGWVQIGDVTEDFYAEVEDSVVSVWYPVSDPTEAL